MRKNMIRIRRRFVFLRMLLPDSCVWSKFWLIFKTWPLGLSATSAHSVIHITHLPCTHYEFHWTPMHRRSIGILCSWVITNAICRWNSKDWQAHIVPLDLQNTSSKTLLLKMWIHRASDQAWGLSECRVLCNCTG